MTPHPGYRIAWIVLHVAGIAAGVFADLWTLYFVAVAALEAIALARRWKGRDASGTWSWAVWAFLFDADGSTSTWRVLAVALWSVGFGVAFALRGFLPTDDLNAFVGVFFNVWLWGHFFGHRRRAAIASMDGPDTGENPGRGGGGGDVDDRFEGTR